MVETGQMIGARAQLKWRMVVPTRTRIAGELLEWQQGEVIYGYDTAEPYRFQILRLTARVVWSFAALAGKKPPQFAAFAWRFGPLLGRRRQRGTHLAASLGRPGRLRCPGTACQKRRWRIVAPNRSPSGENGRSTAVRPNIAKMLRERSRAGQEGIRLTSCAYAAEPNPSGSPAPRRRDFRPLCAGGEPRARSDAGKRRPLPARRAAANSARSPVAYLASASHPRLPRGPLRAPELRAHRHRHAEGIAPLAGTRCRRQQSRRRTAACWRLPADCRESGRRAHQPRPFTCLHGLPAALPGRACAREWPLRSVPESRARPESPRATRE